MEALQFAVDGVRLHGGLHAPRGRSKGGLLLVHGFNSSIEEFGKFPEWFADARYTALAFDQRGFGKSGGETGRTSVAQALPEIAAAAGVLRKRVGKKPLGIVGHSLGGAYAAAALADGVPFQAAVLAHPVDNLMQELNVVERAFYHAVGRLTERRMRRGRPPRSIPYKTKSKDLFVSIEAARAAGRPDFLLKGVNLGNYRAALDMTGAAWAKKVRVPTMVVVSPFDKVVRMEHSARYYDALREPKALLEHQGGHSCFRDLDGRFVADGCIAWFDRHLRGRSR